MGQDARQILDGMEVWVRTHASACEAAAAEQLLLALRRTRKRLEPKDVQADDEDS